MQSKTMTMDLPKQEAAGYRTAVNECIAEVDRILKRIRRKDAEIEKSQRRTRTMLTEMEAMR